ncbi:MAG: hypothetical protein ABI388_07015 [Bacteroidia bacterium]
MFLNKNLKLYVLSCLLFFTASTFGQSKKETKKKEISKKEAKKISKADSLAQCVEMSKERDLIDIYRTVLRKKPPVEKCEPSKKAGNLHLAILPAFGYSLVTKLAGVVTGNGAFYTDNEPSTKLSSVNVSVSYTQKNQIILPILSNIWTKKNKFNLLGDWRYYKYPEYTYGLGGHTHAATNSNQLSYSNIIIHEAVLRHIGKSSFYAGLAYNLDYHWGISEAGTIDGQVSDFKKYGLTKSSVSSGISVNALFDNRTNSINQREDAIYGNIAFCPNFTFLGSNHNYQSLVIDLRKYFKVGRKDNVIAFWNYNWFTFNGNVPYLDLPSTGWDPYANIGRGYIQSRFRGKNLLYLEAEYRFGITRNGLFGGVVFANAQSVTDWPSNKFQTIYPAVGSGIRIKLNKHSNINLAIDYALGLDGSRGVFINLGEVF